ncbi:uncharacterized protein K452DRAFT_297243 [Aplosporella prunicola CBS 121167]|uniref:Peptidase A1 domain-containing protein n=1 Tax=Aplosporella prunicola CBS 121167 TaxID=1176127 RepID=A0A6A6BH94_9PEZI|nr:uncharacterized protein K452DRAFT_297243 [Aplosporella prunicola CBS 121167]KAF2143519.1 hypothetical protein K452DRAFT_297243 [Aplosporella prunicola CBS 121167]
MLAWLLLPGLTAAASLPMLPLNYKYGGYPKISADIKLGEPAQHVIETVVDLGSADFWVYGPNATIFYGSPYLGVEGPCNVTAEPYFNYPESSTASAPDNNSRSYSYGGHSKIVSAYYSINDTLSFATASYPSLPNTRVELSNKTLLRQRADVCTGIEYEKAILGLAAYSASTGGPNLRRDLVDSGRVPSSALSLWFDAPPADVKSTYRGSALFGGVPKDKYAGPLVSVQTSASQNDGLYYLAAPTFTVTPPNGTAKKELPYDKAATQACLVDSGTGTENLPFEAAALYAALGLIEFQGRPAFNAPCAAIPANLTLDYAFPAASNGNKTVTVRVPLRSYARGISDAFSDGSVCGLSFTLGSVGSCVLGAPFFTAAFLALSDEGEGGKTEVALAQGGVSNGAEEGAVGEVVVVGRGEGLPVDF